MKDLIETLLNLLDESRAIIRIIEIQLPAQKHSTEPKAPVSAPNAGKTEKHRSLHDFPLFSPFDIAILRAASHEWQSAAELAQGCGEKNNANFYASLRSLANRGILQAHPTHGWRLCSSITPEEIDRVDLDSEPKAPLPTRPAADMQPPESRPDEAQWFGQVERKILDVASDEWQSAADFAALTGETHDKRLYALLANLADRGFLEANRRQGYRIPPHINIDDYLDRGTTDRA